MMSLRPPANSRTPSPGANEKQANNNSRQSMGPSARGTPGLAPSSPRPGGGRPTSELLNSPSMFQTPEAEAIDQWFENLQNYEATLEDMANASTDVNFKEELSAIEQWFKVLSEAERTAALYSLLQHSTQVQIRFFITVLQQMARSDPMTALLSPAVGGSMQAQMEAKLATLKSPGLNSKLPASPTARNFSSPAANRQSVVLDTPSSNFLSPDSAATPQAEAAATLAQQRAKLKANNASHRISAPVLSTGGADGRNTWGAQLSQVVEQNGPVQEVTIGGSRPKSTEFSGTAILSPRPDTNILSPAMGDSWASMVNTPLIPMFGNNKQQQPQAAEVNQNQLGEWAANKASAPGVPRMGDPTVHRRPSKAGDRDNKANNGNNNLEQPRNGGNLRNTNGGFNGNNGWAGARSPALSNVSSNNRFGGSDDGGNHLNGLGMHMPGVGGFNMGMASPGLGMPGGMGMPGMGGMAPISPFNVNMNMLSAMGISPEAQLLAAQMAASGLVQPNAWLNMQAQAGMMNQNQNNNRRGPGNNNRNGMKTNSANGRSDANKGSEEDVDPALLNDIPAWLRSLRLHKYTPNFETMKWQDIVIMDEAALEAKGVAALGARRKMLKTFDIVRKKMGIEASASAVADSAAAAASIKTSA